MEHPIITLVGFVYLGVATFVWCGIIYYMFRTVKLRKKGVDLWRGTAFNPFNLILFSSKLTSKGLKARQKMLICFLVFIGMVLLPIMLTNLLKIFT
jgi:hypothetical protein